MLVSKRLGAWLALAVLAGVGVTAMPRPAEAWWRGGWCCGVRFGVVVPPVVVAPPPVYYRPPAAYYYAPPPAYYAPPPAYYAPPPAYYAPRPAY